MACLSSRIPYGEAVTPEKLTMIEAAENVLRDLGFYDLRVRHHELSSRFQVPGSRPEIGAQPTTMTHLARIEVGPAEIPKLLQPGVSANVAEALKKIGY